MNDESIILYRTFYNPMEASIIRAKLEDSGIPCFLTDEHISTIQPLYNQAIGGVKLMVFERDKLNIDVLLTDEQEQGPEEDQFFAENTSGGDPLAAAKISCPRCSSAHVAFGQATKHRFSWWVTLVSILLAIYPFKVNHCFHCFDCGHEFR